MNYYVTGGAANTQQQFGSAGYSANTGGTAAAVQQYGYVQTPQAASAVTGATAYAAAGGHSAVVGGTSVAQPTTYNAAYQPAAVAATPAVTYAAYVAPSQVQTASAVAGSTGYSGSYYTQSAAGQPAAAATQQPAAAAAQSYYQAAAAASTAPTYQTGYTAPSYSSTGGAASQYGATTAASATTGQYGQQPQHYVAAAAAATPHYSTQQYAAAAAAVTSQPSAVAAQPTHYGQTATAYGQTGTALAAGAYGQTAATAATYGQAATSYGQPTAGATAYGQQQAAAASAYGQPAAAYGQAATAAVYGQPQQAAAAIYGQTATPATAYAQPAAAAQATAYAAYGQTPAAAVAAYGQAAPTYTTPVAAYGTTAQTATYGGAIAGYNQPSSGAATFQTGYGQTAAAAAAGAAVSAAAAYNPSAGGAPGGYTHSPGQNYYGQQNQTSHYHNHSGYNRSSYDRHSSSGSSSRGGGGGGRYGDRSSSRGGSSSSSGGGRMSGGGGGGGYYRDRDGGRPSSGGRDSGRGGGSGRYYGGGGSRDSSRDSGSRTASGSRGTGGGGNYGGGGGGSRGRGSREGFTGRDMAFGSRGGRFGGRGGHGHGHGGMSAYDRETFYCDVCKISCAGAQTYKEHMNGQRHRKREAQELGIYRTIKSGLIQLKCELCNVVTTTVEAFYTHIKGAKHKKTTTLHHRLGKEIPAEQPVIFTKDGKRTTIDELKEAKKAQELIDKQSKEVLAAAAEDGGGTSESSPQEVDLSNLSEEALLKSLLGEDAESIGEEYVGEIQSLTSKAVNYRCRLCECSFTNEIAKEMHLKGRRHRLAYKKKVDPSITVSEPKSASGNSMYGNRRSGGGVKDKTDIELRVSKEMKRYEHQMMVEQMALMHAMVKPKISVTARRPDSTDDRYLLARSATISPSERDILITNRVVSTCENILKNISDTIKAEDMAEKDPRLAEELYDTNGLQPGRLQLKDVPDTSKYRMLKGVMRVGKMAKRLLVNRGTLQCELVLLTANKPTKSLMTRMMEQFSDSMIAVCPEGGIEASLDEENATFIMTTIRKEPEVKVLVRMSSPAYRPDLQQAAAATASGAGEDETKKSADAAAENDVGIKKEIKEEPTETEKHPEGDSDDFLTEEKCLEAFTDLRHATWYQNKVGRMQSCVTVIRLLVDLAERNEHFRHLSDWTIEVLCEKIISAYNPILTPSQAVKLVLQALAGGFILPSGPGLADPCEKGTVDILEEMEMQEREEATAFAQKCLRLIEFKKIYKILDMEEIPEFDLSIPRAARKRKQIDGEKASEKRERVEDDIKPDGSKPDERQIEIGRESGQDEEDEDEELEEGQTN